MMNFTLRGVPAISRKQVSPSAPRRQRWSGVSLTALALLVTALVGLAGCDKPPTFSELLNGKKKEEPAPPPPPKVVQAPSTPAPVVQAPKEPEKPKRAPQEVIAEFNSTPPQKHTDAQIIELASTPEAADQYTELNLNNSGVSNAGLAALSKFDKVEKLNIDNCPFTNAGLANVAKMKNLTSLSMNGGVLKESSCDQGLASIKEMHQLTSLSLESANVTPKGLAEIAQMTWLESLNVARTRFNGDNLQMLAPLVNLKELNISYTMVGDSAFEYLLPFNQLETLKIAQIPLKGTGLKELAHRNGCPLLRNLVMFGNDQLDRSGYEGIYGYRKTLESLDVGLAALTNERFEAILGCTKMERLLVHDNKALSDDAMVHLPKLRKLKTLYFWKNPGISDASLPYFLKLNRSLENLTLNVTNCTENGVRQLKRKMKNCQIEFNYKKIE
jgi:hypothetical protein